MTLAEQTAATGQRDDTHMIYEMGPTSQYEDGSVMICTPPNLVISLSLYAPHARPRHMALRPIRKGHEDNDLITLAEAVEKQAFILELAPGSLVIFNGILNHTFKHAIPQEREKTGERVSLTYREFL